MSIVEFGAISGDLFIESDYFQDAEPHINRQWDYYIWPMIKHLDLSNVIDLAAGYGRNTAKLAKVSDNVTGLDINQACVDVINRRFAALPHVSAAKIDGASFGSVADNSISLVYCWDAMVHFEPNIVSSYVEDAARVLEPGGVGFIHHSNYTDGLGSIFTSQPHWRNYMSRELFASFVKKSGLEILVQRVISWDESAPLATRKLTDCTLDLDCITVFKKPICA